MRLVKVAGIYCSCSVLLLVRGASGDLSGGARRHGGLLLGKEGGVGCTCVGGVNWVGWEGTFFSNSLCLVSGGVDDAIGNGDGK